MSLYVLPVSISDLTQLQLGLEFSADTTEATTEVGLINQQTATVDSYTVQLLANNISFSQVAMAVDSLMFGVTDNVTELTKLATGFLPPQVNNAVKYGLNPTVYAAEALGLALAGGNGTSNAFATDFGSLSLQQFTAEVASLTGVNPLPIHNFVVNWISFYTANPNAIGNLSVTLAAYGAAFGDAVGAALLNPTFNGATALVDNEVQNALIDNAEGLYIGVPLAAEPPHIPLQGEAVLIPDAGGLPLGSPIDWAAKFGTAAYAEFVGPPQTAALTIFDAPGTFTLNTQEFATNAVGIDAAGHNGELCTLIVGGTEDFGPVEFTGYPTVNVVANGTAENVTPFFAVHAPAGGTAHLVVSGSGYLGLGTVGAANVQEGDVSVAVNGGTITDVGVQLSLGITDAETIDASSAPHLGMAGPASLAGGAPGVTVLGGAQENGLQGSLGGQLSTLTYTNGTTQLWATIVGVDNITGGSGGADQIYGDGGPDTITLPSNHLHSDLVWFGTDGLSVLAITDSADTAYPGFWGATVQNSISGLFSGSSTGGTSADMTTITGFHAGSPGDQLFFETEAWAGASTSMGAAADGDLVRLDGVSVVSAGAAQLSVVWVNHTNSNPLLTPSDTVLLYAPAGGSPHNAQQLAAQLHGASGEVVLPGNIAPGQDLHILVAYDATVRVFPVHPVVNIADVDLVNTSGSPQNSTNNLNVYASDMVSLVGVSLASLTSDNIHFFQ